VGTWVLHVTADAKNSAQVAIDVRAGLVSAAHCVARGPGLEGGLAGAPSTFLIKAMDKFGNLVINDGTAMRDNEVFAVAVHGTCQIWTWFSANPI
jgi:hypothetical protein